MKGEGESATSELKKRPRRAGPLAGPGVTDPAANHISHGAEGRSQRCRWRLFHSFILTCGSDTSGGGRQEALETAEAPK